MAMPLDRVSISAVEKTQDSISFYLLEMIRLRGLGCSTIGQFKLFVCACAMRMFTMETTPKHDVQF